MLSFAAAQDQNVRFQKPAQNEHFYRLSCRAEKSYWIIYIKVNRSGDSLHSDPRYAALLKKMGLPQ
jgi:hypothetical protein